MSRIARRYARALYSLTQGDLVKAKREQQSLTVLRELYAEKDAGKVLKSPIMPPDLKKALLTYGLDQANADEDLRRMMDTMLSAGRVALVPDLADSFDELIDEAEGLVRAEVVSAVALKPEDVDQIGQALGTVLGKKVLVKTKVEPSLLGGFEVRVGNYRIDMSLRTKLDGLSQSAVQDNLR